MGTVIKAGSTGKLMKRLEQLVLKDHMAEARAVVRAARVRAQKTIVQAEADAAKLREDARQSGYETGFTEGRTAGEATGRAESYARAKDEFHRTNQLLTSQLTSLVSSFESSKRDLLKRAQQDLLAFAVMVAERIAKRTGAMDHRAAVANATEAIRQVGAWTDLVVRVHRSDLETMREYAREVVEELTGQHHVRVVEDSSIEPGGCIVESPRTRVDATLSQQFNEVVALLLGETGDVDQESSGEDDS